MVQYLPLPRSSALALDAVLVPSPGQLWLFSWCFTGAALVKLCLYEDWLRYYHVVCFKYLSTQFNAIQYSANSGQKSPAARSETSEANIRHLKAPSRVARSDFTIDGYQLRQPLVVQDIGLYSKIILLIMTLSN